MDPLTFAPTISVAMLDAYAYPSPAMSTTHHRGASALLLAAVVCTSLGVSGCEEVAQPELSDRYEPYEQHTYFFGLQKRGTISKTGRRAIVRFEDGQRWDLSDARRADRQAWRARHGKLSVQLAEFVHGSSPHEVARFLVRTDDSSLVADLKQDETIEVIKTARFAPFVVVNMPIHSAKQLAMDARLDAILGAPRGVVASEQATVLDPKDESMVSLIHQSGFTGKGVKIGVVEPGRCRVRDTNVFIPGTVRYTVPSMSQPACVTDANCNASCPGNIDPGCHGGFCADGHGTAVVSLVSQIAPDAEVVYANNYDSADFSQDGGVTCEPDRLIAAYDSFVEQGVDIVAEAYNCISIEGGPEPYEVDGYIQDYYSRTRGILTVRGAGNDAPVGEACQLTLNSLCSGSATSQAHGHHRACYSAFLNPALAFSSTSPHPTYGTGLMFFDREEPDLMAVGGESSNCGSATEVYLVASPKSDIGSNNFNGTSAAAPVAAAQAALMLQQVRACEWDPFRVSTYMRTHLRQNSIVNVAGTNYSTLKPGGDHEDGAGLLVPWVIGEECGGNTPLGPGGGTISWVGEKDPEDGDPTEPPFGPPEYETPPEGRPQNQGLTPGDSGYVWSYITEPFEATEGQRIRVTYTWEACAPDLVATVAPAPPGTDYDVFLVAVDRGPSGDDALTYFSSQTNDDNTEGLDVVVDPGWGGRWRVAEMHPAGSVGCNGESDIVGYRVDWWGDE